MAYDFSNPNVDADTALHLDEIFTNAVDNFTCNAPSDAVVFPQNTRLEACVRKHVSNNRWPLICSDAANIKKLECNDTQISSLDGLQQFPNIEILSFGLKGTEIEDLAPIRNLTKLNILSIPNSNISDTSFLSLLTNLKVLELTRNHISNLRYMPYLTRLESLSLEYQAPDYISDITPLRFLNSLRNLSLQGNKITDITALGETRSLAYLTIRDNRIADISPLANLPNLVGLNASINMISDITPLANLLKLSSITVNSNRLDNINAIESLTNLNHLSFIGNAITDISPIANKRKLKSVSMDYNGITDLSSIYTIKLYTDLSELGLAYNCVPEENWEQISYLNDISKTRLDHQCETFDPKDAVPDISFVVNGDLVGAEDMGLDNVTSKDANAGKDVYSSAGRGCSAGAGEFTDIVYIATIVIFFIKFINTRRKHQTN